MSKHYGNLITTGNITTYNDLYASASVGVGLLNPIRKYHQLNGKFLIESNDGSYGQFQLINPTNGEVTLVLAASASPSFGGPITSTNNEYIWAFGLGSYGYNPDSFIIGNNYIGGDVFRVNATGSVIISELYNDFGNNSSVSIVGVDSDGKLYNTNLNPNNLTTKVGISQIAYGNSMDGSLTSSNLLTFDGTRVNINNGVVTNNQRLLVVGNTLLNPGSVTWDFGWNVGELLVRGTVGGESIINIETSDANAYIKMANPSNPFGNNGWSIGRTVNDFNIKGIIAGSSSADYVLTILGTNSYMGFGTTTPTAKYHLKTIDSSSSNYALKIENNLVIPLLYIKNDGNISIGTSSSTAKVDIQGDTLNNLIKVNNSNFLYCDKLRISNDGSFFSTSDNSNYSGLGDGGTGNFITGHLNYQFKSSYSTYLAFTNAGGAGNRSTYGIIGSTIGNSDWDYKLTILNNDSGTLGSILKLVSNVSSSVSDSFDYYNYGLNIISSGTFSNLGSGNFYKVGLNVNVSNADLNYAALFNGGYVGIGTNSPNAMLDVVSNGSGTIGINLNTSSTQDAKLYFRTNNSASARSQIYLNDSTQTLNFYTRNNDTIFWNGNGLAQTKTLTLFTDTTVKFESNVGVGISPNSTSRFIIQGIDSTSSYYALKIDNSSSSPLLYVKNDGSIIIPQTYATYSSTGTTGIVGIDSTGKLFNTVLDPLNLTTKVGTSQIAYGNSIDGGLTSSSSLTFDGSTFIINADLTVTGTTSIINTRNVLVQDPIILLASTQSGTPILDSGFFINRGIGLTAGFIWDESQKEFAYIKTNDNDSVIGNVNILEYSNVRSGTSSVNGLLYVKSGNNTYDYSFKIDDISSNPLLSIRNDGVSIFTSAFDGITSGNANYTYTTTLGGLLIDYNAVDSISLNFSKNTLLRATIINNNGYFGISSKYRLSLKTLDDNKSHVWFDSDGLVGIGNDYFASSAQLHIKGIDSSSGNYALKVENYLGGNLFSIRNDGAFVSYVYDTTYDINLGGSVGHYKLSTSWGDLFEATAPGAFKFTTGANRGTSGETGVTNVFTSDFNIPSLWNVNANRILVGSTGTNSGIITGLRIQKSGFNNTSATFYSALLLDGSVGIGTTSPLATLSVKPTGNLDGFIIQENASNFYLQAVKDGTRGLLSLYDGGTPKVFFNSPTYAGLDFINTGMNLAIGLNAASAKVHIYGIDSTSSNYALKVDNSSFSPLLYVKNNGDILLPKTYETSSFTGTAGIIGIDSTGKLFNTGITPSVVSSISGTGFSNYIPRWTSSYTLSSTSSIYDDGTYVGIGSTTSTSTLYVKGNSTYAFIVENSVNNNLISLANDGLSVLGFTGGNARTQVNLGNSQYFRINAIDNAGFALSDSNNDWFRIVPTAFDEAVLSSNGVLDIRAGGTNTLYARFNESAGGIGINTQNPSGRLHIVGIDSTSSNYALKVDNSSSSPLLYVKNDGFVSINQNSIGAAKLEITGGSYQGIYVQSSGQIALNSLDNTGFANKAETNSGTAYRANLSGISSIGLEINYTPSNLSLFKVTGNGNIFALPTYTDTLSTGTTSILGIDANGKLFNSGLNPNNINKVGFGEIAYGDYTTGTLTSSNIFTFTSSNVGIGITSPTAKLEIFDSTISIQKWSYNSINKGALFLTPNAVTSLGISSLFNDKLTFGRFNVSGASNGFGFVLESTSGDFTISPDYTGNIDFIYQRSSRNIGIRNTIPSAVLHISDRDISTNINLRLEPVNNVTQDTTGATINTTDNTTIILQNISVPTDVGYLIEVKINCRKTGGAGTGTTGDTNAYIRTFKVKNVSGTLTLGSISSTFTSEDISGNSVSFDVSGTNVRVLVTGTTNNNITWSCISTITR